MTHPARYSTVLLPRFAAILREHNCNLILDPMAGTGRIIEVREHGWRGAVVCNDLETWPDQLEGPVWTHDDARHLSFPANLFDAIVTSPTYGNRMADHHEARDGSKRITYRHRLGRPLRPGNTGAMQWGEEYRLVHLGIWRECLRVLRPGGIIVVNVSDFPRKGQLIPVTDWHRSALVSMGASLVSEEAVATPRMRFGANGNFRATHESIITFVKVAP